MATVVAGAPATNHADLVFVVGELARVDPFYVFKGSARDDRVDLLRLDRAAHAAWDALGDELRAHQKKSEASS